MNNDDLLKYAMEHDMLDMSYVQTQMEMERKKEILKKYGKCIWYSQNEDAWYCHLPDDTRPEGRRKIKRKKKNDIEQIVCDYYDPMKLKDRKKTMTLSELFFEYMEHKKKQVQSNTIKRMMIDWKKFYESNPAFISRPFIEITKVDIDDFLNGIVEKYNPKDKNFFNLAGILKQVFEYAVDMDYIDKSPYRTSKVNRKKIISTKKKIQDNKIFSQEEQDILKAELKRNIGQYSGDLLPWIILFDFECGARIGEILALKYSDILDGRIHICRQLVEEYDVEDIHDIKRIGWHVADYTKSMSSDRWIPLTSKAVEYINEVKKINIRMNREYDNYIFITTEEIPSVRKVDQFLGYCCVKLGMPSSGTHKIRKTYASTLYSRNVSVVDIAKLLGHSDERTTLKHYIFSVDTQEGFDEKIRNALEKKELSDADSPAIMESPVNSNIISFTGFVKKTEKEKLC